MKLPTTMRRLVLLAGLLALPGCAAYSVADAVVSTAANAVEAAGNVAGAAVEAVVPDGDDD